MKRWMGVVVLLISLAIAVFYLYPRLGQGTSAGYLRATVKEGEFQVKVQSSATVAPENRILVVPPVAGRIDKFYFDEGQMVKKGETVALMSSQDRVALMESPQSRQPAAEIQAMYRQTPLIAPHDGLIVSRPVNEGQNVSPADRIFEIANRLVVESKVDESDIAAITLGQKVEMVVDAFRGQRFVGKVIRIGHQSVLQNNINTYVVLIEPEDLKIPIRSGMSVSAYFVTFEKLKTLLLPAYLAQGRQDTDLQMTVANGDHVETRTVSVGKSNGENVEVLGGLALNDTVLYRPLEIRIEKGNVFGGGSAKTK